MTAGNGNGVTPQQKVYAGALLYGLAAMTMVLMIAALYYLVIAQQANVEAQKTAVESREKITEAVELLLECTTPPQERKPPVRVSADSNDCYQRGLRQQGDAVASIGDLTIRAACAAEHAENLRAVDRCVLDVTDYIRGEHP